MNRRIKSIICAIIAVVMIMSTAMVLFACGDDNGGNNGGNTTQKYDPETRPVTFATSALDGTFNPFFTTSATDSTIANFTQIGMLSTSNEGEIECGIDVPTVVLDYSVTSYDLSGKVTTGKDADRTVYEFVIKNGIKFSDGVPLTIDDVLFNLYVYLDPMYSGSSTIYSVAIKGLNAYQTNRASADDNTSINTALAEVDAQQRINNIISWAKDEQVLTQQISDDIEAVKEQLKSDLESEWNTFSGTVESNYKEYAFTEDWEVFYFEEGFIRVLTEKNSYGNDVDVKDGNGKYVTELHVKDTDGNWVVDTEHTSDRAQVIYAACSNEETIAQYMRENDCTRDEAIEDIKRDTAINQVYNSYTSTNAIKNKIESILSYGSTASAIYEKWKLEELAKQLASNKGNVKSISGITTRKASSFNGVNKTVLTEEHDILTITIDGIDPKAIWNFAFAVAPMHYYSDADTLANKADYPYGVRARDKSFFDNVLNSKEKNALPVGAGAYRASNSQGNASENPAEVNSKEFWKSKKVYFQRNDYFESLGGSIKNAKIKRLTYIEISENNILNNLITEALDYGTPSATPQNKTEIAEESHLATIEYKTSGYGYVGINPKYVKELEVRQAIMMAFDTSSIIGTYYGGTMAENIYRPISKLSWAYPTGCEPYYKYDSTGLEIEKLVEKAGYKKVNGKYVKGTATLKFKFTIAGDTTDHPAAQMFEKARQLLNAHGFDITVDTDVSALQKLARGDLEVWAAAWSSTIDPDMYQVYHKDSKTTNVKNWNYDGILNTNDYPREKAIVLELSDLIDAGRKTNNKSERIEIYSKALDKIMDLAVEFPTYQRKDLAVYNQNVIDASTLNTSDDIKYSSPTDRIWELNYL